MTNRSEIESRLQKAGIRPTAVRILIMDALGKLDRPISSLELEMRLDTVDRSSISRTLALLLDKGLVHTIDDGSGSAKFELCHCHSHRSLEQESSAHDCFLGHSDLHAHFHCVRCGKTVCLPDQGLYIPQLPAGYVATTANFVITGLCPDGLRRKMNKDAGGLCILPVNDWHRQEIGMRRPFVDAAGLHRRPGRNA